VIDPDLDEDFAAFLPQPEKVTARPILKWVGGKTQLLPVIFPHIPEKIDTYYEPFIGGAALFFALASDRRFTRARLNDWNPELVNLYSVVRDDMAALMTMLDVWKDRYEKYPEQTFAGLRSSTFDMPAERAARTVFLNKTGFNGLYRQNKKGEFNVPWGKKPKVGFYDEKNVLACALALALVDRFTTGDFAPAVVDAGPGDLVYMDPPYIPHSDTSNFTGYTSDGFSMEDQGRVAAMAKQLVAQGAKVIVSNNDVPAIYDLFAGPEFEIVKVEARRNLNSDGEKRGPVGEVLVIGRP
jgi:DNA adenine methylase